MHCVCLNDLIRRGERLANAGLIYSQPRTFHHVESDQLLKELFGVFADCLRLYSVLEFNHKSIIRVLDIFDEKTCMRQVIQRQFGILFRSRSLFAGFGRPFYDF
jgi:hypothetical protein